MDDITTFIAARLDELERAALAATSGTWKDAGGTVALAFNGSGEIADYIHEQADIHHIVMHQPEAVLRDVEATRHILALHEETGHHDCRACREHDGGWPCQTVHLIASRWADHPAHRPEWAPAPEED